MTHSDIYTKEQLHEAFTVSDAKVKELQKELNRERLNIQGMFQDVVYYREKFYAQHFQHNVPSIGTPEEQLQQIQDFFKTDYRIDTTPSGSYFAYEIISPTEIYMWYSWRDPDCFKDDMTDMLELILKLSQRYQIYYTGVHNVLKNHSILISDPQDPIKEYRVDQDRLLKLQKRMNRIRNYSIKG